MKNRQKEELLNLIGTIGFNMFDTVLFLDTHPNNQEALAYYHKYHELQKQAVKEYTTHFGPLSSDDVNDTNRWTWVETPWPWEMED